MNLLLNNGSGTFANGVRYFINGNAAPTSIALADVHGDGKSDFVTIHGFGAGRAIRLNNGDGDFTGAIFTLAGRDLTVTSVTDSKNSVIPGGKVGSRRFFAS